MFENEIAVNHFLFGYVRSLVGDLIDERMAEQPVAGVNHPAWILGHLAYSGDVIVGLLGGTKTLTPEWNTRFNPGSKLTAVRSDYPKRDELMHVLEERFETARKLAAAATVEQVSAPTPNPRMKDKLPVVGNVITLLLTAHFGVHLGQLSAWRRMIGLPPLF